jgi:hypothetical protein
MKGVEGIYDDECGLCGAHFDLNSEDWMEADSCNVCRPCFDAMTSGDLKTLFARAAGEVTR